MFYYMYSRLRFILNAKKKYSKMLKNEYLSFFKLFENI